MEIIKRKDAKRLGMRWYFTGKPCKHGHIAKRQVVCGSCVECRDLNKERFKKENPDYWKENYKKTWLRRLFQRNRKENLLKKSEYNKKYWKDNAERLSEYDRKRRSRNRDTKPWLDSFRSRQKVAKKKGIKFTITQEWCKERWTGCCELSGIPFVLSTKHSGPYSPTIDKIDPTQGYIPENCRFVLYVINSLKSTLTDKEMLEVAEALVNYDRSKK